MCTVDEGESERTYVAVAVAASLFAFTLNRTSRSKGASPSSPSPSPLSPFDYHSFLFHRSLYHPHAFLTFPRSRLFVQVGFLLLLVLHNIQLCGSKVGEATPVLWLSYICDDHAKFIIPHLGVSSFFHLLSSTHHPLD